MTYLIGLLVIVVGLLVSVALHELGHLLPAKRFGVMVPEYWVGFGPTLWSTKIGDTRYGIKVLPLGGYVRLLGMYPPANGRTRTRTRSGKVTVAEQARQDSAAEVAKANAEGMQGKPLWAINPWKKAVVIAGGPIVNLLLGFVFTAVVVVGYGSQEATTTLADVNTDAASASTAAAEAGLQAGDQVLTWNGMAIDSWEQLRELVADSDGQTVTVQVQRGDQVFTTEVTAQEVDGAYSLGVTSQLVRVHGSWVSALRLTGEQVSLTGQAIVNLPVNLWETLTDLFTGQERSENSIVSVVGVARVAGEITSVDAQTTGGTITWVDRAAMICYLLASLNIALFVFNLIPLPPLDGGHFVTAIWGGIKNAGAKLLSKPQPAPVDSAKGVPLAAVVFTVLIALSAVLIVADLVNPVTLFS